MTAGQPAPLAAVEALAERFTALGLAQGVGAFVLGQEVLAVLAEHGYTVVRDTCTETTVGLLGNLTGPPIRHCCVLGPHDGDEHRCGCGLTWRPAAECHATAWARPGGAPRVYNGDPDFIPPARGARHDAP